MARAYQARSRIRLLNLDGTVVRQQMKLVKAGEAGAGFRAAKLLY